MKNVVIVDTNFLVSNIGNIKEIIKELAEKEIDVYVPEIVKEEFINIQLRKLEDTYNKLESLKNLQKVVDLKYRKKEESRKIIENSYNSIFEYNFNNKIILYNKENMLDRVLQRNKYKQPPFYNENNSSDKGFKDTIILFTIMDFLNEFEDEAVFYFITSDKEFDINEQIDKDKQEANIFSKNDMNLEDIRKRINELMDEFIWTTTLDFYGNPQDERRFGISSYINNEKTENFLNNIDDIIEKNIFRNDILIENFFDENNHVSSDYTINVDTMKEISKLYKNVKNTKYKEAFINYISQRINENKVNDIFTVESDDDLPF